MPPGAALALTAVLTTALLSAQQSLFSLPPDTGLHVQAWDTSTGLPQNTVTSLATARDGTLWVGTFGGLCAFDGVRWDSSFSTTKNDLDQRVTAVHADADGTLWVGTQAATLQRLRNGKLEQLAVLPGVETWLVRRLADGRLVCGTDTDTYVVGESGAFAPIAASPIGGAKALLHGPDGGTWLLAAGGIHHVAGGKVELLWRGAPSCGLVATDGTVYVGTDGGLIRWRAGTFEPVPGLPGAAPRNGAVAAIAEGRGGELWIAYAGLLCRFSPTGASPSPSLALPLPHRVRVLHAGSDGGIWAGCDAVGLARLRGSEVVLRAQVDTDGVPIEADAVLPDGEGGWFVGSDGGLFRWRGERFEREHAITSRPVAAMASHGGAFWFGVHAAVVEVCFGEVREHVGPDRIGRVRAIHGDGERLWCGTDDGLWLVDRSGWHEQPAEIAHRAETVKLIAPGAGGSLWIGTTRCVSKLTPDRRVEHRWCLGADLPNGEVRAVLPGANGRTWIATYGGGFLAIDGERVSVVGPEQGLLDRFVCSVLPLEDRWLVGSNRGPYLLDPAELDLVADGKRGVVSCRPLLGPKGPAAEANGGVQPNVARHGDVVMMSGVSGLLEIDLRRLQRVAAPSRCRVERVLAGGRLATVGRGAIRVDAAHERVFTVDVTASEFDAPDLLRFQWRLLPRDERWSAPETDRRISFDVDTPGGYRFEVAAVGVDGSVGAESAAVDIVVEPRLTEQAAFRYGLFAALAVAVLLAVRFGGRRHAQAAARLARLVDARTAELQRLHGELERRVVDRTRELQHALQRLEHDHAQRLQLERELQTFQRMESLGALAGGIAHDFNNLLTVVLGNVSLLEVDHPGDADLLRLAQRIRDTAEQGQMLTRHLMTVASQEAVTPTVIDLVQHVRLLHTLLAQLAGDRVRVELELPDHKVQVSAAAVQVEQILTNLCANARDAMPAGGTLHVAVTVDGERALLRVRDNGAGMSDEVKRRAFDPFFTTKKKHGGTGMGLATVYGITKQLGGSVSVDSTLGAGTTFTFSLPLVAAGERIVELPRVTPQPRAGHDTQQPR